VHLRARYYSPANGRFISQDSWSGNDTKPLSYNSWLYAYANPIIYIDPTGKYASKLLVNFEGELGALPWTQAEKVRIYTDMGSVAIAYAKAYNREMFKDFFGECMQYNQRIMFPHQISPLVAFLRVHNGPVTIKRKANSVGGYWGEAQSINLIYIFNNATNEDIATTPRFIVHEMGHVFENALYDVYGAKLGRLSITESLWWRGYAGSIYGGFAGDIPLSWQFSRGEGGYDDKGTEDTKDDTDGRGEIFADMFVGWVYSRWEDNSKGLERSEHMNQRMDAWIYAIVHAHGGPK
jgi:hypothetical protein